jgi:hypothetical protein
MTATYFLTPAELAILKSNDSFEIIPDGLSDVLVAFIAGISADSYSHSENYDDARDAHIYGGSITVEYLDEDGDESEALIAVYRGYVVTDGQDDDSGNLDFDDVISEKYTIEF